jgi:Flp pilus assembly protein TadG
MLRLPVVSRIGRLFARFTAADQGNIAVIFAIALVPVLSFVGAAVDYTRAVQARSSMQSALDSTALMVSKDLSSGTITTSQIGTKAQSYFNALFTGTSTIPTVTVGATYTASTSMGSTIQVTGTGTYTTSFMKIAGFPTLDLGVTSTSAWGLVRMRVAMVLDVTGSMADDGKMPAMQTAAKNLVDQLSALAKNNGDVYISVVPFSKDVNVGSSNYSSSWMDFTDWDAANGSCSRSSYTSKSTCVNNSKTWTPANHNTWTGCVTDRDQDYDTKNTTPTSGNSSTQFPAEQYSYCNSSSSAYIQPIMPLSYDWTGLKTLIGKLVPTGNTNQGIGLAWGWMTLSTGDPMNAPAKDANYTYKDAIVLLSDGLNTQNRWYSNASQIDARQKKLCDNAKAANITIYTVQVNTGHDATSSVLQYCASGTDKFYLVTAADQTVSVFKDIGTSLSKLRVAR